MLFCLISENVHTLLTVLVVFTFLLCRLFLLVADGITGGGRGGGVEGGDGETGSV